MRYVLIDYMHLAHRCIAAQPLSATTMVGGEMKVVDTTVPNYTIKNIYRYGGKGLFYTGVFFEGGKNRRKDYFKEKSIDGTGYKGNRSGLFSSTYEGIDLTIQMLLQGKSSLYRAEGFEADDLIYAMVKKIKELDSTTPIDVVTNDSDLLPLVDDQVSVYIRGTREYSEPGAPILKMYYQVTPRSWDEYLSYSSQYKAFNIPYNAMILQKIIRGDKSDNIAPAVEGYGGVKFSKLMQEMRDSSYLYTSGELITKVSEKVTDIIISNIEKGLNLYKPLIDKNYISNHAKQSLLKLEVILKESLDLKSIAGEDNLVFKKALGGSYSDFQLDTYISEAQKLKVIELVSVSEYSKFFISVLPSWFKYKIEQGIKEAISKNELDANINIVKHYIEQIWSCQTANSFLNIEISKHLLSVEKTEIMELKKLLKLTLSKRENWVDGTISDILISSIESKKGNFSILKSFDSNTIMSIFQYTALVQLSSLLSPYFNFDSLNKVEKVDVEKPTSIDMGKLVGEDSWVLPLDLYTVQIYSVLEAYFNLKRKTKKAVKEFTEALNELLGQNSKTFIEDNLEEIYLESGKALGKIKENKKQYADKNIKNIELNNILKQLFGESFISEGVEYVKSGVDFENIFRYGMDFNKIARPVLKNWFSEEEIDAMKYIYEGINLQSIDLELPKQLNHGALQQALLPLQIHLK